MNFNWKFELKWTPELKSSLLHAFIGCIIGLVSSFVNGGWLALGMVLVFSWATGLVVRSVLKWQPAVEQPDGTKKYATKWWLGNGFYPFFAFWLFCWVLFYNIL